MTPSENALKAWEKRRNRGKLMANMCGGGIGAIVAGFLGCSGDIWQNREGGVGCERRANSLLKSRPGGSGKSRAKLRYVSSEGTESYVWWPGVHISGARSDEKCYCSVECSLVGQTEPYCVCLTTEVPVSARSTAP